jgi:gallate decarboxylase subunit D
MNRAFVEGAGRTQVSLASNFLGNDIVLHLFNAGAHVGAVALAEFDFKNERASVSLITRLGHKDDALAQRAAYLVCKEARRTVCAVAGVHLDDITKAEITQLVDNADKLVRKFIQSLAPPDNRSSGNPAT